MCGIVGKLVTRGDERVTRELLSRMNDTLSHRGPDGDGLYLDGPVGLGHRRLSIIDLGGGAQPMFNADRSACIVFNGEIYNFKLLRAELEGLGRVFSTDSDTEVILAAYDQFGEQCVERLRGMFAFAIWDIPRQRLFLARDRLGIKPLYYYDDGKRLLFASEVKAILEDPEIDRTLDHTAIDDYLTYLYVPAPKSIFARIRKLEPGHTLTVDSEGVRDREYWDLSFKTRNGLDEEEWSEQLRRTLTDSVDCHLVADVPLGAFLSGGLDSSAIVGVMSKLVDRPVSTASIGFTDKKFDELEHARAVARHFGVDPYEKTVDPSAAEVLDRLMWHYDEPFADSSMVPTYYVSKIARERVTVCLSGDGGDENFAGYRRYKFDLFENQVRRLLPAALRGPVFGGLGRLYPKADWLPRMFRAKTLLTNLGLDPDLAYHRTMSWFTPEMKRDLYRGELARETAGYDPFDVMRRHYAKADTDDPLGRVLYVDIKTYLVDDILTKVDRASMANSLEVRVPLLDHEVVEFAASIPTRFKLRGGQGKYIFKKSMEGLVPHDIAHRTKMGFSVPLAGWLRGELKGMFEERVLDSGAFVSGLLDQQAIRRMWQQHQRKTRDYSYHLWALLVLESWGRRFVEGREPTPVAVSAEAP
jgi:asparagine synthase (glutamine-hydrolysing)